MSKTLWVTGLAVCLTACAMSSNTASPSSAAITLPSHTILKEGGIYQTSGYGSSQDNSEKVAVANANETCSLQHRIPVVGQTDTKYQGTVSEDVNKTVTLVSGILKSTTGKNYGNITTDKDYKTTLNFRCQ